MSTRHPLSASAPARGASGRARVVLAGLIIAAAIVPVVGAIAIGAAADADLLPGVRLLVAAAVYAPVAAVSLRFRRDDVAVIEGALAVLSGWFALLSLLHAQSPDGAALRAAVISLSHLWGLAELAALGLLAWLLMPRHVRRPRAGIALGVAALVLEVLSVLGSLVAPSEVWDVPVPLALAIASLGTATVVLARAWRPSSPRERAAARWFLAGALLLLASYARLLPGLPPVLGGLTDAMFVLSHAFLPLGILALSGVTSRARHTGDVVALAQSLAFGLSAYLAVGVVAGALGMEPLWRGALAAAALALVFGATVRITRARLDAVFTDPPPDARQVLERLGAHLARPGRGGLTDLAAALRDTWGLSSAEVDLGPTGRSAVGRRVDPSITVPLVSAGRPVGTVTLSGPERHSLHDDVLPVLRQTAGLIAVAVQLAVVNEEVAATRRRTLDVRREERRILHRELEGALAPALAGVGVRLSAADALLARGDERWREELRALRADTATLTEDVRRLSRTLLPTALDQGDLEGALDELATALSGPGMRVEVDAKGTDVLASDAQLRVYLLLAECLIIARRTEGISVARGTVALDAESTRVTVRPATFDEDDATTIARRAREFGAHTVDVAGEAIEAVFPR
ncbi:hypothetical protein ACWDR7_03900 [Microbacterium sp. NPDC003461]